MKSSLNDDNHNLVNELIYWFQIDYHINQIWMSDIVKSSPNDDNHNLVNELIYWFQID